MAKRLTEKQKNEIAKCFKNGKTIAELSKEFNCTKLTISRNLKKYLGEMIYKELVERKNNIDKFDYSSENNKKKGNGVDLKSEFSNNEFIDNKNFDVYKSDDNTLLDSEFVELSPLDFEIENVPRKELSSVPIDKVQLPKLVYMVVSKNVELEIKLLKDYPEWEFLPNEDLERKSIEIFFDLKTAKRVCSKEQKVIKVPNTEVFKIVSPILISKGISRIVSAEKLIAI